MPGTEETVEALAPSCSTRPLPSPASVCRADKGQSVKFGRVHPLHRTFQRRTTSLPPGRGSG